MTVQAVLSHATYHSYHNFTTAVQAGKATPICLIISLSQTANWMLSPGVVRAGINTASASQAVVETGGSKRRRRGLADIFGRYLACHTFYDGIIELFALKLVYPIGPLLARNISCRLLCVLVVVPFSVGMAASVCVVFVVFVPLTLRVEGPL